jgi:trehalose/maltose transport system substrate-binding protein
MRAPVICATSSATGAGPAPQWIKKASRRIGRDSGVILRLDFNSFSCRVWACGAHVPFRSIKSLALLVNRPLRPAEMAGLLCTVLLSLLLGCTRPSVPKPITLTLLDWQYTGESFAKEYEQEFRQFTSETGVHVRFLPSEETPQQRLAMFRKLLGTGASNLDVYSIDVIWPGIVDEYAMDLNPYFGSEMSEVFPALATNDTVDGKLVAMPYRADLGLLFYRTDLLRQYGYREPPGTWDELESMAARIQAGERAKGNKNFWGFVWQGAAAECLTTNALEWQMSEGGGRIIEQDKTISVNNPQTIRAWRRAARWVGSISPPSVVAYKEWDGTNVWAAGNAAFMRNWPQASVESRAPGSSIRNKFDVTLLPAGKAGRAGTLGGTSLAVSRFSAHPHEALELIRYLCNGRVQAQRSRTLSVPPTRPRLYELPEVLEPNPYFAQLSRAFRTGAVILRPSDVTGKNYEDVTEAYIAAVHSVLTREQSAPEAAAALEKELIRITGFQKGPPANGISMRHEEKF